MLLAEVVHGQHLLSLAASAAVAIVDPFVHSMCIAVAVFQRFLAPLTKHASEDF